MGVDGALGHFDMWERPLAANDLGVTDNTDNTDTICAIATPPGRGGVGIVRVSGPGTAAIAKRILGHLPEPRHAQFAHFIDTHGENLDQGLALYFPAPHSFTGEPVLELHGHGGPVVLGLLMERLLELGARQARPGEFSERAYLNGKLDLAQAEAVADLIDSQTAQAARAASRSLEGAFSKRVHRLFDQLTDLRTFIEATLDFPDEDVEFIENARIGEQIKALQTSIQDLSAQAVQGRLLRDGLTVVIAGPPNAGKSSLLNALAGAETAIVTDIPGTTRDILRERIQINGMPVHVLDTAGLRESQNEVEQEGVRRAQAAIGDADRVLYLHDASQHDTFKLPDFGVAVTVIHNKIDLTGEAVRLEGNALWLSAKTGMGLDLLRAHLSEVAGLQNSSEGIFSARARHLDALARVKEHLQRGSDQIALQAGSELVAEELRLAQQTLAEITGEFSSDELLGRIFSSFCIGK